MIRISDESNFDILQDNAKKINFLPTFKIEDI